MIAGDARPQLRLDANAIGGGRHAERRKAADRTDEMTPRNHESLIVMRFRDAARMERNWGVLVQFISTEITESS